MTTRYRPKNPHPKMPSQKNAISNKTPAVSICAPAFFSHPPILINSLNIPAHLNNPHHNKRRQPARITHPRKRHQSPILAVIRLYNLPRNRNAGEAPDTHNRVAGSEVAAQILGAAQLADADGCQADVGAGRETKEEAEDDDPGHGSAGGEPDAEDHDDGKDGGYDHGVEGAYFVGVEAGEPAPEDGADVKDDEALVGEILAEAGVQRVAAYVRQRDEERPFQQVDGGDGECEDAVAEDA